MIFNKNSFITDVALLEENQAYKSFVNATLPNDGQTVDEICNQGFQNSEKNIESLISSMKEID